jgi:predicted TIM-barrel fold metal-dependent hydrolase
VTELRFFDAYVRLGRGLEVLFGGLESNQQRLDGRNTTAALALEEMDGLGVGQAMVQHVLSYQYNAAYGNRLLMEEIAGEGRLHPVWMVYPTATGESGSAADVAEALCRHRVQGVLLYAGAFRFRGGGAFSADEWNLGDLLSMLEEMHMPVFTRPGADLSWSGVHELLTNHPRLPLVLREVDLASDRNLYSLATAFPNFYVGTENYKGLFALEAFAKRFGSERLLYGSGYPIQSMGGSMTALLVSDLDRNDRENIAGRNMERLIGGINHG